jgi:hypothetical protein
VAPIDDPYQMFSRLYGSVKHRESLRSVLDELHEDLARVTAALPAEDRRLLEEHADLVRGFERDLAAQREVAKHDVPVLEPGILEANDRMPTISRMQIDLLVAALAADFTRVVTLQYTNSVGQPHMKWLGVDEGQHDLSHEPNSNVDAQEKLTRINTWYAGEVAHLAARLAATNFLEQAGRNVELKSNEIASGQGEHHLPCIECHLCDALPPWRLPLRNALIPRLDAAHAAWRHLHK